MLDNRVGDLRACGRCRRALPIAAFNVSSALGLQYYCRECQSAWYRDHRAQHIANVNANRERYQERNAALVLEYLLTHPCVDCGEADPTVLEFDHVADKISTVSQLKWGSAPPEKILSEIERCQVRCVNCHMRRTAEQFGWRKGRESSGDTDLFEMRS